MKPIFILISLFDLGQNFINTSMIVLPLFSNPALEEGDVINYPTLAISNGVVFVAYQDRYRSSKATVMYFDQTQ